LKTLLIVEDEKLIRNGIKTMVQRSGVPVENILDCANGELALEILKEQHVDVMFTDIRMPKMDGIELVSRAMELAEPPLMVAISGYDDFSYAVEMLRHGVREYLLKPVERDKIRDILSKLNDEIEKRHSIRQTEKKVGYQQLKFIFTSASMSPEEEELLEQKYADLFFNNPYVVCVTGKNVLTEDHRSYIYVEDVEDGNVFIVEADKLEELSTDELLHTNAGISAVHSGIRELLTGYNEAFAMRKRAFCLEQEVRLGSEPKLAVPEGIRVQAQKLLREQDCIRRVQLIGTDKTEELMQQWNRLFEETKREHIEYEEFVKVILRFLDEVGHIYGQELSEDNRQTIIDCKRILEYTDISCFEEALTGMILDIHTRINNREDVGKNGQKMKEAVEYIRENYNKDLNMAVVSNHISMNYSLFSCTFKQYTGSNFVNYLKELRITKAKQLLADTDMKIIEISQTIGYENEKHFMKIFKAECGVSPSEYRKNMQKE